ncbi:hypothetical protein FF125_10375 [Aureibaculum algae]|uniref:Glycosyl transferase family 1 domain-containing protein n=1 Tax=Aureibaculum algae TaxID=2584122 RepID=A0A5B7TRE8_9FLAO|nr:glycosyltransferase [Aureibaculum algae]QCX38818.1 hypothetical protein FF125_10375 [Aureibaculum algae]
MEKNKIGIYPWAEALEKQGDKHQILFYEALEKNNYNVVKIKYKRGLPLKHALKQNVDLLVLDWVHSFYTSQSIINTVIKAFLGYLDLVFLKKDKTIITWNLHNLQRHDGKFGAIEKFCFKKLAKKVDYIRVFNKSHVNKVSEYLKIAKSKIIVIPQGPYIYNSSVAVNIHERYIIPNNKNILLVFGSIRSGKGIDKFLKSFVQCKTENFYLLVAGKASEMPLNSEINEIIKDSNNIIFDNRFIPDEEVNAYFKSCQYVVLPYENTLNSGILLLAKSNDSRLLANENFKEYAENGDVIGDLFIAEALQESLNQLIIKKRDIPRISPPNWDSVVKKFEKILNE